jgi:hypothetical protein
MFLGEPVLMIAAVGREAGWVSSRRVARRLQLIAISWLHPCPFSRQ